MTTETHTEDPTVGQRLKKLRDMFGLSQRELARRANVTNGTISLIEQGEVSPSIGSLKKVLSGFPIPLADFFSTVLVAEQPAFFKKDELTEIADGDVRYLQVGRNLQNWAIQMLHEEYAAGADTGKEMLSHAGEESGIIVSGQIEITVGGQVQLLGPGEAYYFNCRLPHRFRNRGKIPCILISACTPPTF
jgi:transcriptional regulator with XRE-family HTH domain